MRRVAFLAALTLAAFAPVGCKSDPETASPLKRVPQFSDVPVPAGFTLQTNLPDNYILETGSFRSGQQTYVGDARPLDAVAFLEERLPQHGWALVSRTSSPEAAHLTYRKNDTTADLDIARIPRSENVELRVVLRTRREAPSSSPGTR